VLDFRILANSKSVFARRRSLPPKQSSSQSWIASPPKELAVRNDIFRPIHLRIDKEARFSLLKRAFPNILSFIMEDSHLYQQIVSAVRQQILSGRLQPGDRLPSIREMTAEWGCTPGTVQRAYHELAIQELVVSRPGQGTHVVHQLPRERDDTPLRRAALVHRAQAFLLEVLTAGYTTGEVETALQLALDQWRVISEQPSPAIQGQLRFVGSHDLALAWIAAHFSEIAPRYSLELQFTGSLGGLIALAEGKADLAGSHLWDEETDSYNIPYVRRLLPGQRVALLTLAQRRLGLITPASNPASVLELADLQRPGLVFVNRQPGSGTRVWLDAALRRAGISAAGIRGYEDERATHSEVARAVAEGKADAGFGLQTAAMAFGLNFIPLVSERYELVIPEGTFDHPAMQQMARWLAERPAHQAIHELGGYETDDTGKVQWVN
jgi:putative molybdopterin biosynthesis protein